MSVNRISQRGKRNFDKHMDLYLRVNWQEYPKKVNLDMKRSHGGKREGSGRKPKFKEETTTISFRVPKSKVGKVKKLVKDYLQTIARENSNR